MRTLATLAFLVSVNAWAACPELTGTYNCNYSDGSKETVTIKQENKDGIVIYDYNGSSVPADNQIRQIPDDQTIKQGTFRAWCDNESLKTQMLGKYYQDGQFFGDLTLNMDFTKVGTDLKATNTGFVKNSAGEYPLNSEVICNPAN